MPAVVRRMVDHTLDVLRGYHSKCPQFVAEFDSAITTTVFAGTVVRLNSSGRYVLGVGNNLAMPMFLYSNSDDEDVANYGGNPATEKNVWVETGPTGMAVAFVGNGGFELMSTEFVKTFSYPPNTLLTSPASGADAGKLRPGTLGTDTVIGIVSRGVVDNGHGHEALAFWTHLALPQP